MQNGAGAGFGLFSKCSVWPTYILPIGLSSVTVCFCNAVSRNIIAKFKGEFRVASSGVKGEGCAFSFEVPLGSRSEGVEEGKGVGRSSCSGATHTARTAEISSGGAKDTFISSKELHMHKVESKERGQCHVAESHVLLVDDSTLNRKMIMRVLKELGVKKIDEVSYYRDSSRR